MTIDVVIPQMGESIFEGTVTKWLKKEGDTVTRDEPLFEVSTDKVDSEIASPGDGVLEEILVPEGETVKIGAVIARIGESKTAVVEPEPQVPAVAAVAEPPVEPVAPADAPAVEAPPAEAAAAETQPEAAAAESESPAPSLTEAAPPVEPKDHEVAASEIEPPPAQPLEPKEPEIAEPEIKSPPVPVVEPPREIRTSPLVRRIARDYGVDLSAITGAGLSGRITKEDIFAYLERLGKIEKQPALVAAPPPPVEVDSKPAAPAPRPVPPVEAKTPVPVAPPPKPAPPAPAAAPPEPAPPRAEPAQAPPAEIPKFHGETETFPMTPMRKAIAERMIESKRTSAHVHTVFEVDMTSVANLREKHMREFEAREGIKLNYTAFFVKALVDTVREFPILNCSVSGDTIIFKKSINVGVAVALGTGLIVPVIRDAQLKSFTALALAIHDVAERARSKKLKPEEVQQGTITVTNPGVFGSLFGTPIINQPQVAILCVGGLEKRPMIINDAIAIRTMVYLALSFDHRVIDGAVADQFMAALKARLQSWTDWVE